MSRKRGKKPKPRPDSLLATKGVAAQSQLETAIWLWFHYGDPLSILALAANASDCYDALGGHAGRRSIYKAWLTEQSQAFQDRARYVYDFIRHGHKDLKQDTPYSPKQGEMLIVDCIDCHAHLFGDITPMMSAFNLRLLGEGRVDFVTMSDYGAIISKLREIDDSSESARPRFLKAVLDCCKELRAKGELGRPEILAAVPMTDLS